ncbi:MAG: RDD family protein [Dehalococcoidia bacterium]
MAPPPAAATSPRGRIAALPYAGLHLRIVAFILDVLVLMSFGMLFAAAAAGYLVIDSNLNDGNLSDESPYVVAGLILAYIFAFVPLYHTLMWTWWGQTVGKMAVHVKVMSAKPGRLSFRRCALRFLGYAFSVLPFFLGILMALFDSERRMLHDHLAGTVVVELP